MSRLYNAKNEVAQPVLSPRPTVSIMMKGEEMAQGAVGTRRIDGTGMLEGRGHVPPRPPREYASRASPPMTRVDERAREVGATVHEPGRDAAHRHGDAISTRRQTRVPFVTPSPSRKN